ncbi:hypothetical protein BGX23_011413 [Mortierella sp. AD031]|nr:hypothetical protein BGX23_011413 [Mortierella sp. AD031]
MVDAGQLLKKPIVCRGLEVFRCQVVGLGRLFATEEAAYETCLRFLIEKGGSSTIKAKDIQDQQIREILPFLQTADEIKIMRDLRILEVGASNKDGKRIYDSCPRTYLVNGRLYYEGYGPTPYTLKLSLDSGLDRLESLKNLEVFAFDGVDHRIQIEELTWMSEAWPRLRLMRGIQADEGDERCILILCCPKTTELREHMKRLRPLVKHEPGYF